MGRGLEEKRPHRAPVARTSGDESLAQYRLYFLHGPDRHISYSHEFEARDDEHAVQVAEAWREGRGAELWTGSRKVKSWESDA
jgi:hypothetical protein